MIARHLLLEQLADLVYELTQQVTTAELIDWRPSREHPDYADRSARLPKPQSRVHRTHQPGLLTQLASGPTGERPTPTSPADLVTDMAPTPGRASDNATGHSKPGSRPPASLALLEQLEEVTAGIAHQRARLRITAGLTRGRRATARQMLDDLAALVVTAHPDGRPLVADHDLAALVRAARSWVRSARIALAYDAPPVELDAVCAVCGGRMLVARDATSDVWCAGGPGVDPPWSTRGCRATWPRHTWLQLLDEASA